MACSCEGCSQKGATLSMLGWLPSGFSGVGAVTVPDAGAYRAGALIGLGIGGVLSYGGYSLWKSKRPVWGGLLLILGMPGVISSTYQLATGEPLLGRR